MARPRADGARGAHVDPPCGRGPDPHVLGHRSRRLARLRPAVRLTSVLLDGGAWLDREWRVCEVLTSIRRAGADLILKYWATEAPPGLD
ncbi:hypothetical protein I6J71_41355 [Amycolatopsis sp. FDAARGOS 1241]|nr:hypothetical protein I6J71_41355 [Amycolatopsis sp. FDAARGOS 1241]